MDDRYKILLGSKGTQGSQNEDVFISLGLKNSLAEIKPQQYNNTFDVAQQFSAERNTSRDFRIYGIVDSNIVNCNNLIISGFSSSATTSSGEMILSGFLGTVQTTPLAFSGYNAYGLMRGKYIYGVSAYTNPYIYFEIEGDNINYTNQIFSQQVIFYDANGNFVPYGTQTVEVDNNGNTINIDNNFYFLYNKHWVKSDLPITWTQPTTVSFSGTSSPFTLTQGLPSVLTFDVSLAVPSTFGNEQVDLNILPGNTLPASDLIISENNTTIISGFPYTMSFSAGEQFKTFYATVPSNSEQDLLEDIIFSLDNWKNVYSGTPSTFRVNVINTTAKNEAIFNFQSVFNNRNYFTGWRGLTIGPTPSPVSAPFYSVLRNGLFFDATDLEFYPCDSYSLIIQNLGINTVFPASGNTMLSVVNDSVFASGSSLSFNINIPYTGGTLNTVQLQFPAISPLKTYVSTTDGIKINGVPIISYGRPYTFNYTTILNALNGSSLSGFIYPAGVINEPFTVSSVSTASSSTITLTSISPGLRLDLQGYGLFSGISSNYSSLGSGGIFSGTVTATTIQSYLSAATQNPLQITLRANSNSNNNCYYGFTITKNGYKTLSWTSNTSPASTSAPTYYLASSYNNILRNYNDSTGQFVYNHQGVSDSWTNQIYPLTNGLYNVGDAYINGIALLANVCEDNTINAAYYSNPNISNLTNYGNSAGNFVADFFPSPIPVYPQTSNLLSPQTSTQVGYFIAEDVSSLPPGYTSERSFDFATGFTPSVLSYYGSWHSSGLYDANFIWGIPVYTSGSTTPAKFSNPVPLSKLILNQGVSGITYTAIKASELTSIKNTIFTNANGVRNLIKLFALTPGNPFVFQNLQDFRNSTNIPLAGNKIPFLQYFPLIPNEIAGVTINQANNMIGGYTTIKP